MRILFALLTLAAGIALVFGGYRLARFIIPLWGFVAGLSVGGSVISAMNDTPFLGTFLGVLVGLGLGVLLAALAYLYYSVAVVVLVGAVGYWLGSSFILLFGFNPGVLSFVVGLALGIAFGLVALLFNAPKYFLVILSSIAGAMAAVGGVMLLFNQIPLEAFNYSAVNQSVSNSFLWTMVALALAIIGIVYQVRTTAGYEFEAWTAGSGGHHLPPTPTHHTGTY